MKLVINKQVWLDSRRHYNRKDHFGPDLGLLSPNLVHKFFFEVSALLVSRCNPAQYQEKLMMQTWENGEDLIFGPKFFFVSFTSTR